VAESKDMERMAGETEEEDEPMSMYTGKKNSVYVN
jgi:hypothetical protein